MVALGLVRLRRLLGLVAFLYFASKPLVASERVGLLGVGQWAAGFHGGPDRAFAAHVRL